MRIVIVAGLDPLLAQGHALHVRHLVDELAARGHAVDLIARDDGGGLAWSPPGRFVRVPRISVPLLGQVEREIRTARLLLDWMRRGRPDVVLARSETLAFAPLLLPRSLPLAVESNSSLVEHEAGRRGLRFWLTRRIEGRLLLRARRVGVVAPGLRDLHVRHHQVDPSRMFVVRNGASLPPLVGAGAVRESRADRDVGEQEFVLALAGSASERIEFGWLVAAAEATPRARLWVIGQGELWQDWQDHAHRSGARDRIDFLGALPEAETARLLQSAQVVVAPYREGCIQRLGGDPLKVLSGMASGRPLLASGLSEDPPFAALGAGTCVEASRDGWVEAVREQAAEWTEAGHPLHDWPWPGEGPGRAWIRANRSWAKAAAIWEHELEVVAGLRRASSDLGT